MNHPALEAWRKLSVEEQRSWFEGRRDGGVSLLSMAGNLVAATVAHVADGGRIAGPDVQAERLEICRTCPHFEPTMPACRRCGCGSVVKGGLELKISWASSACPLPAPRWAAV
jgi:hypothetical protein